MRKPQDVWNYIKKDGDYHTFGRPFPQLKIKPQKEAIDRIKNGESLDKISMEEGYENILLNYRKFQEAADRIYAIRNPPRTTPHCKGLWIHGPSGVGKDFIIRGTLSELNEPFYLKQQNKWFDGYNHERIIYLDDAGRGLD